eukprot:scaffold10993_cov75-Phaeocystis_antarctica.AAC.3
MATPFDSDVLADWAQPVFLAMFCLAATAALVLSVQERANSRGRSPDPSSWRGDDAVRALIGRWFSTLGAGARRTARTCCSTTRRPRGSPPSSFVMDMLTWFSPQPVEHDSRVVRLRFRAHD